MIKVYFLKNRSNIRIMQKILKEIKNILGVSSVFFNFFQNKIKITYNFDSNFFFIEKKIYKIIENNSNSIKNTIDIKLTKNIEINYYDLSLYFFGFIVFFINLFFINCKYKELFYIFSFMLIGKIIWQKIFKIIKKKKKIDENYLILLVIGGSSFIGNYIEAFFILNFYLLLYYFNIKISVIVKNEINKILCDKFMFVNKIKNNLIYSVCLKKICIGDTILVKQGEIIPLDGIVVEGSSCIDMSLISTIKNKKIIEPGMNIQSGSINLKNSLHISILNTYNDKFIYLKYLKIQNMMNKKSTLLKLLKRTGNIFIASSIVLAFIVITIIPIFLGAKMFEKEFIYKALIIVSMSSTSIILYSIFISYNFSLVLFKKLGIVINKLDTIDYLGKLKTLFFSKRGILTKNILEVIEIIPYKKNTKKDLIFYAAAGEIKSEHIVAKTIKKLYTNKELNISKLSESIEEAKGIKTIYDKNTIFVGNEAFFLENNLDVCINKKGFMVHVALNNKYIGAILFKEKLEEEAFQIVEKLKKLKINRIAVITGEISEIAKNELSPLNIRNIYGDLNTNEKIEKIEKEKIRLKNKTIGFTGDSSTDKNIFEKVNIGFCYLKNNLEKTIDFVNIVLLKKDLNLIYKSILIGKQTYSIIKQNIFISFVVKIIIIIFVLFFYIESGFMIIAIFIDLLLSFLTILNSFKIIKDTKNFQ